MAFYPVLTTIFMKTAFLKVKALPKLLCCSIYDQVMEIYLTTKGFLQMNHIEMALLKKEIQRLKEDYDKCEDEKLKVWILEDIQLIEQVINQQESETGTTV